MKLLADVREGKNLLVGRGIKFLLCTPQHVGSQLQQGDIVMLPGMHRDSWQQSMLTGIRKTRSFLLLPPLQPQTSSHRWMMMVSLIPIPLIFVMFSPSATMTAPMAAISQAVSAEGTCKHFPAPCKPHSLHLNWDADFSVLLLNN